jgi:hypothetical protein
MNPVLHPNPSGSVRTVNIGIARMIVGARHAVPALPTPQICHSERRASVFCWLGVEEPWRDLPTNTIDGSATLVPLLKKDRAKCA